MIRKALWMEHRVMTRFFMCIMQKKIRVHQVENVRNQEILGASQSTSLFVKDTHVAKLGRGSYMAAWSKGREFTAADANAYFNLWLILSWDLSATF